MSKDRLTFTVPETSEEIKSTWLARGVALAIGMFPRERWAKWIYGLAIGGFLIGLLISAGFAWMGYRRGLLSEWPYPFPPFAGWYAGGGVLLLGMLFYGLLGTWVRLFRWVTKVYPQIQQTHDAIARWQHLRRQRLLRARDHVNVPDGALSRAQPPSEPTPTDAALSVADTSEEKDRLTASTETSTEGEVPVKE